MHIVRPEWVKEEHGGRMERNMFYFVLLKGWAGHRNTFVKMKNILLLNSYIFGLINN